MVGDTSKTKAMKATLWDGTKQLDGDLELNENHFQFHLSDFSNTNLNLDLAYDEVQSIKLFRIFKIELGALEITSIKGTQNVFVVDDPIGLKNYLEHKIKNP